MDAMTIIPDGTKRDESIGPKLIKVEAVCAHGSYVTATQSVQFEKSQT
jgi:hypothetical protein